ncbi:MAG: type IV toxin-antitoxin system AbiEi family antitoxin domain-containing protein, partial [Actinomycetota bacterium]|nr:type IV toxin-antitoxin system AbiEi family antitoxin domain-containing protein [Actinomycetota bacterium]
MSLVLSRAEALASGQSARQVDALVRSGRWLALRRGIYLTQPALPADPAVRHALKIRAAALATGVPCVGSSTSAAVVHRLPLLVPHPGPPVLTRLRHARQERPNGRAAGALVAQLPPQHCTVVH